MAATFGDTNSAISNFSEVIDIINQTAMALENSFMVMGNLVTRHTIPSGEDRVRIPFQTQAFEAQDHTDGDEITNVQQFGIDTIDLTTNMLEITYRISRRALRQPAVDLAALAGEEQAKATAEALEVRLLSLLDDAGTQDLNAAGAASTLAHVRTGRRMLRNIARVPDGGPAQMVVGVINPIQEENLLADLGVDAATTGSTNTQKRVLNLVNELISISASMEDAYFGSLLRIPFFVSQYIAVTNGSVTSPSIGGMFSKKDLLLGVAEEWEVEPFRAIEWPGIAVRAMTDYGSRVSPFPKHVLQFDTAVA